jgi:hypothetical protein
MPEHGSELNRSSRGIGLRRAKHGPPVADLLRPIVVVLNAGTVVRVRLDRKVTSAGAGECRLLAPNGHAATVASRLLLGEERT